MANLTLPHTDTHTYSPTFIPDQHAVLPSPSQLTDPQLPVHDPSSSIRANGKAPNPQTMGLIHTTTLSRKSATLLLVESFQSLRCSSELRVSNPAAGMPVRLDCGPPCQLPRVRNVHMCLCEIWEEWSSEGGFIGCLVRGGVWGARWF